MGRDPEDKLKEAILMLDVLAQVEALVDHLDEGRELCADDVIETLKGMGTELIDYRRHIGLPEYAEMLAQAREAGDEYAVSPEARRRQFKMIKGEKDDESTEEAVHGDQPEAEGRP